MGKVLWTIILFACLTIRASNGAEFSNESKKTGSKKYEAAILKQGDPRFCQLTDSNPQSKLRRLEVLPGVGWDNLQNIARGQVIDFSFSKCMTTTDGRFLVPDQVFTTPIKQSYLQTFAEIIKSWHSAKSTTSHSINVNAGLQTGKHSVSGSFSYENIKMKEKQIEDEAVTVQVQLRYHRYDVHLQPDSPLHPAFKRRLLNIAANLQKNETDAAYYEGQLLVRDFGTHVLTSATAGAGLTKTDFLKRSYIETNEEQKTNILTSASYSFALIFKINATYGHGSSKEKKDAYEKKMTRSYITSHGGPILKAYDMSANLWTSGVDMDLVAMDRNGDPLSFLVTEQTLPDVPRPIVHEVEKVVRQSIVQYYEENTYHGCTEIGKPQFSSSANFDDGSCGSQLTNVTFGGVYQQCNVFGNYLSKNPCDGLAQVNPKTSRYTCPRGYTEVKIMTGRKLGEVESKKGSCESCGFLWLFECCDIYYYQATAVYTAYWCAGLGHLGQDSGYLFGGLYSHSKSNPFTGTKDCPPNFYPRLLLDHYICISDDFEQGRKHSIKFGGFMSCSGGNPLSLPGVKPVGDVRKGKRSASKKAATNTLQSFMAGQRDPREWPKRCPQGYSQHLLSIFNGCEIQYCVKSGALYGTDLPPIRLPPFVEKPVFKKHNASSSKVAFDPKTMTWYDEPSDFQEDGDKKWQRLWSPEPGSNSPYHDPESSSSMKPGISAGLAALVALVSGMMLKDVLQ